MRVDTMSLIEDKPGTTSHGVVGRTFDVSCPAWPEPVRAKEGAPNVTAQAGGHTRPEKPIPMTMLMIDNQGICLVKCME